MIGAQQFSDVRPGHNYAFIDVELVTLDPGTVGQIGGWFAGADAGADDLVQLLAFGARKPAIEPGLGGTGARGGLISTRLGPIGWLLGCTLMPDLPVSP